MRKILLLLSSFVTLANASFAQDAPMQSSSYGIDTKKLRFGAYVAPTMSWMRATSKTDDNKNYNITNDGTKVGFTYGLMAEYYFQDNYAIVTGLQMNSGGGKLTMERVSSVGEANTVQKGVFQYNISYLEIPVGIKLRTDPISNFRLFGQVGLTLGINVAKKASYDLNYYDSDTKIQSISQSKDKLTTSSTFGTAVAPVMLSMNIGLGAEYPLTDKLAGYIGIFFNNGFLPDATSPQNYELYDNANNKIKVNSTFKDGNVRFNNFALRLGVFF
ncbi:hypothetical protein DBR32_13025 [Taibaiella sp. KBW10]|uniref:porin family protein n=1 Tax=Taibaiella sp. KBW10 TaxID=2153357 RepID=UPI000F59F286|nr:porin family protein [Taibaiella sp. KBW10]RQO30482.1 hypothetical protein DBR32_13025 [Taibaiella sp. KBW10]